MSVYGDMTDDEIMWLRDRHGDIVYEAPAIALMLLENLRQIQAAVLLEEMEEAIRRQRRRNLH